jgi:hypothetical protein
LALFLFLAARKRRENLEFNKGLGKEDPRTSDVGRKKGGKQEEGKLTRKVGNSEERRLSVPHAMWLVFVLNF